MVTRSRFPAGTLSLFQRGGKWTRAKAFTPLRKATFRST
jgi:hypothetical protein